MGFLHIYLFSVDDGLWFWCVMFDKYNLKFDLYEGKGHLGKVIMTFVLH